MPTGEAILSKAKNHRGRDGYLSVLDPEGPGMSRSTVRWPLAYLAYFVAQCFQLWALFALAPRFFWLDDSQRQFGPMLWWLGRNQRGGRPPLMDPDLGMAGNAVADMQYGVLDPLHWMLQFLISRFDNFIVISWIYGSLSVVILGAGALCVLRLYGVKPVLAVAGALGVASSGFFMWFGSSWWPLMWSTAWLPWLWVGLASKRWPGVIVSGLALWAILASGNPYAVPFAALLLVVQIWEYQRELGFYRSLLSSRFVARMVACAGGVIVALPTLLTAIQIAPLMGRQEAEPLIGNAGFAVPNLGDVILGGMTLLGQTNGWGGSIGLSPAFAPMLVAIPLLALVSWEKAFRSPGVPTGLILIVAAATCTQLPTIVGVFRNPLRHIVIFQVMVSLLALIAVSAAPNLTKRRVIVAGLIVTAQFVLAEFRAPVFFGWHFIALCLTVLAGLAALSLLKNEVRQRQTKSIILILCVVASPFVGERMMVSLQNRVDELEPGPPSLGRQFRQLYPGYGLGVTVDEYRAQAYAVDETLTVMRWGHDRDEGWNTGVVGGNGNLIAGLKPGFGSIAVAQAKLEKHWCRDFVGQICSTPEQLLEKANGTDKPWMDVLASDIVVLHSSAPIEIRQYFDSNWNKGLEGALWVEYQKRSRLPGRITVADGTRVSDKEWFAGPAYIGRPMESYVVSTAGEGGSLIFRTPYWPGFRATLNDGPARVSSVDQSVLKIDLPADLTNAKLQIYYDPIGARISTLATLVGIATIIGSALAAGRFERASGGLLRRHPSKPWINSR